MNTFRKEGMRTPKILENLPERLRLEARRQVLENGWPAMTMRSVAAGCGVGVGTVYNYYPSKEALTAAFMLGDWQACLAGIEAAARDAGSPQPVLDAIHREVSGFADVYRDLFRDAAAAGFAGFSPRYHRMLRAQLAAPLRRFCPDDFTAEFIAEALLTWTVAGTPLPQIRAVVNKLFEP